MTQAGYGAPRSRALADGGASTADFCPPSTTKGTLTEALASAKRALTSSPLSTAQTATATAAVFQKAHFLYGTAQLAVKENYTSITRLTLGAATTAKAFPAAKV